MFVVLRAFCVLVVLSMIGILVPEASAQDSVSAALAKEKAVCHATKALSSSQMVR